MDNTQASNFAGATILYNSVAILQGVPEFHTAILFGLIISILLKENKNKGDK